MNIDKCEIKILVSRELGAQYAAMAKAAEQDVLRQEGARDALKLAAQRVGELGAHVDKDLEEGVLSAEDLKDPKRVEIYIKRYIKRMWGVIDNLATTAEVARLNAFGRQRGLENAGEVVRALCQSEQAKLAAIQQQIESGSLQTEDGRALDGHPGLPLKYQREDEAAADAMVDGSVPGEMPESSVEVDSGVTVTEEDALLEEPPLSKAPSRPRKKPTPKTKR